MDGQASIDGEIKMISYQGSVTRFSVEADSVRLTAEMPAGAASFNEGERVRLTWPRSAMVTMEDGA
jgi:ABC-type Fe3+/spermidine/putrescine transport system ATPase subunit